MCLGEKGEEGVFFPSCENVPVSEVFFSLIGTLKMMSLEWGGEKMEGSRNENKKVKGEKRERNETKQTNKQIKKKQIKYLQEGLLYKLRI